MGTDNVWITSEIDFTLIITILVSVLTLIIPGIKSRKSLSYELLQQSLFLTNNRPKGGVIKVLFNDEEVKNVQTLLVRLKNTGYKTIEKSDFEDPIELKFVKVDKVLLFEITESSPSNLPTELSFSSPDTILIKPLMLNQNDYFDIKVILSSQELAEFHFLSRINGVSNISLSTSIKYLEKLSSSLVLAFFGGLLYIYSLIFFDDAGVKRVTLFTFVIGLLASFYSFIRFKYFPIQKK